LQDTPPVGTDLKQRYRVKCFPSEAIGFRLNSWGVPMQMRVLILLSNGFEVMEAACFTEVLGWASIYGNSRIDQLSVGLRSPVRTTFGFDVVPEGLLGDINVEDFDALVIPGGFGDAGFYEEALSQPFLDVIRNFDKRQAPIAAVCVSALSLAAAGVLNGKRATVYHQIGGVRKAELEGYGAIFVDAPLVIDGHLMTSTGPGTGVELALKLLERLSSPEFSLEIRERMRVPTPDAAWFHGAQV
jgi:4-methyl-5(b-hydroxyethyl)-thiazole monophosphate biosynthesis